MTTAISCCITIKDRFERDRMLAAAGAEKEGKQQEKMASTPDKTLGLEMKKAYLIALTMALLCVPSMQVFADEDDVSHLDMDEFSYENWEDTGSYFNGYTNDPLNGQNTAPCPYEPELADYQSPVRLLHVGPYSGVRIINAPQEDGAEIGYMYSDEVMLLVDDSDEAWYKVTYDGQDGYVSKYDNVKVEETYKMPVGTSENRVATVNYAMGFLGGKYAFGGRSKEGGYDCSGLVSTILQRLSRGIWSFTGQARRRSIMLLCI